MAASLSLSRALVASSRMRIGALRRKARARARRWRCPPETTGAAFADDGGVALGESA
jgi:hypothetical protein